MKQYPNPCTTCTHPCPDGGCKAWKDWWVHHWDTCPGRQAWVEEGKRISRNRRTYYTKLGEEAKAAARRARKK